jgi:DNA-binding response OmpR family regulator
MGGGEVDILVIDDDPWIVELVVMAAEERNWTVQSAADGPSGLKQLGDLKPRLVLLDVRLPRQDGWTTLQEIHRKVPNLPNHPPIIMMTADQMDQDDGKQYGAAATLRKPFSIQPFLDLLSRFLEPEGRRS